jgi:hypothetical protein
MSAPSTTEARREFVLKRSGGACEYRTGECTGTATRLLIDAGWHAMGFDGAPAFAIHAACQRCYDAWARF